MDRQARPGANDGTAGQEEPVVGHGAAGVSRLGHMATPRLAAKAVLRYDQVRETHLLLLPERVVQLNRSSAAILALCDGSRTIEAIVAHLEAQFATGDLTKDVTAFLRDAYQHGWVVA